PVRRSCRGAYEEFDQGQCSSLAAELPRLRWSYAQLTLQLLSLWPPSPLARSAAGRFRELLRIARLVGTVLPFSHPPPIFCPWENRCSCSWLVFVCEHE